MGRKKHAKGKKSHGRKLSEIIKEMALRLLGELIEVRDSGIVLLADHNVRFLYFT